jgi:glutathione S-transferase
VIGDYITVCDFVMVEALEFASWIWEGLYDTHPKMKAYYERMVSIPEVN